MRNHIFKVGKCFISNEKNVVNEMAVSEKIQGDYSKGASYLLSKTNYDRFVVKNIEAYLGRDNNLFASPKEEIDNVLKECGNDPRLVEKRLGLDVGALGNGDFMRVDIPNAMDYPMSNPTNTTPGANDKFVEGGKTFGGVHEIVFHNVPTPANNPTATQASIIHIQSYKKKI